MMDKDDDCFDASSTPEGSLPLETSSLDEEYDDQDATSTLTNLTTDFRIDESSLSTMLQGLSLSYRTGRKKS